MMDSDGDLQDRQEQSDDGSKAQPFDPWAVGIEAITAEAAATLPEGTPVAVIWSGDNGPHDYVIAVDRFGQRYAAADLTDERMKFYNPLRFVGQERYHTRVWLKAEAFS